MKAWIDRNWNLLFHKKECVKIMFFDNWFNYNDIISTSDTELRYLGNNWYKVL